jgi:prolyl-tRNA synthetase
MRLSRHFGRTLREAPADATLISHRLVTRAGLARPLDTGVWSYLPLGWRVVRRIEATLRAEMAALGGQEVRLPGLPPPEAATPETTIAGLCRVEIESYKDLPRTIYQLRAGLRDEARAGSGLLGLREFLSHEAYSIHATLDDLQRMYDDVLDAYRAVLGRCGLDALPVEAENDPVNGPSHAFVLPHPAGDIRLVRCDGCDYAALIEAAAFERAASGEAAPLALEKVATPDCKTIADLCTFLEVEPPQTLKVVFYTVDAGQPGEGTVLAMLRGDLEISEAKLLRALSAQTLQPATEYEIRGRTGAEPGYASPLGLKVRRDRGEGVTVIADRSLEGMVNFVTGANEAGYHVVNANYPRDFAVSRVEDIAEVYEGAACVHCGGGLHVEPGIELARCRKLGTGHSEAAGAAYLDADGKARPIVMGSYRVEVDRLLAAIVEAHHDEYGIIWPPAAAPFDVHLVALSREGEVAETAEALYADLQAAGIEALYDDRDHSPGVMFADADLIGVPLRLTVSRRSLSNGGVEVKWRHAAQREVLPLEGLVERLAGMLDEARS